jgi:broad specificity phosphatase PhoE
VSVVLLVRHGQASWGAEDYDRLSPLGERQARVLGAALTARGVRPDLVVHGTLRRHRQTAAGTVGAAGWDAEVVQEAGWDELDHLTTLTGRLAPEEGAESDDDRVRRFEAALARWAGGEHDAEYHESFPAFRARVEASLTVLLERLEPGATAVVFTSGGPVSWVTAALTAGGLPAWPRLSRVVVNSSVTKVLTGRRGTSLVSFNDHSHLEEAGPGLLSYR